MTGLLCTGARDRKHRLKRNRPALDEVTGNVASFHGAKGRRVLEASRRKKFSGPGRLVIVCVTGEPPVARRRTAGNATTARSVRECVMLGQGSSPARRAYVVARSQRRF